MEAISDLEHHLANLLQAFSQTQAENQQLRQRCQHLLHENQQLTTRQQQATMKIKLALQQLKQTRTEAIHHEQTQSYREHTNIG